MPLRICLDEDNIDVAFILVLFLYHLQCAMSMASHSVFELRQAANFSKAYLHILEIFMSAEMLPYFPSNPLNVIAFEKLRSMICFKDQIWKCLVSYSDCKIPSCQLKVN